MNNITRFLTQIRPLINAKGVERAGGMPANSLGVFYSRLDAGENPGLSENALLGLFEALPPIMIMNTLFRYYEGGVAWSRHVRDFNADPDPDGTMEFFTVEHRGVLRPGEIAEFINGLEWPEKAIYI